MAGLLGIDVQKELTGRSSDEGRADLLRMAMGILGDQLDEWGAGLQATFDDPVGVYSRAAHQTMDSLLAPADRAYRSWRETGHASPEIGEDEAMAYLDAVNPMGFALRIGGSLLGDIGNARAEAPIIYGDPTVSVGPRVSTRTPTMVGSVDPHTRDDLLVSLEAMKGNPGAYKKNMGLLTGYSEIPTRFRNPDKVADFTRQHVSDNLMHMREGMPDEFFERSGNWYKGANAYAQDISKAYGISQDAAAGILARLSPKFDWEQNVEIADRLANIWSRKQGVTASDEMVDQARLRYGDKVAENIRGKKLSEMKDSKEKAEWIRMYDEAHHPMEYHALTPEGGFGDLRRTKSGKPRTLTWQTTPNVALAIEMLEDQSLENISKRLGGGHKIRNFFNNISDPWNAKDVTMDTHAIAAGLLSPFGANSIPVGHNFGSGKGAAYAGDMGTSGTYGLYADAYRDAAGLLGVRPMELQSPTWEVIRETFDQGNKATLQPIVEQVWKDAKAGRITVDQARERVLEIAGGYKMPEWFSR